MPTSKLKDLIGRFKKIKINTDIGSIQPMKTRVIDITNG